METSILYRECELTISRAFHELRESYNQSMIRSDEIELAFMESTIDDYKREVLLEYVNDEKPKEGIIATIFSAIGELIKSVFQAIKSIFTGEEIDNKAKDIVKVGAELPEAKVETVDYKKAQKAAEKYNERIKEIVMSGKDADWIKAEAKRAEEQYQKDLKSNFNPAAVVVPLAIAGAGALGLGLYLKSTEQTLGGAIKNAQEKHKDSKMFNDNLKKVPKEERNAEMNRMVRAQEQKVNAIYAATAAATRNYQRSTELLRRSVDANVRKINEDRYQIGRYTGTGTPAGWFKKKWYQAKLAVHDKTDNRRTKKVDDKNHELMHSPDMVKLDIDLARQTRLLDNIQQQRSKKMK